MPPQKKTLPRPERAQAKRFIEAARAAECSEDEAEIRENMKRIASAKPVPSTKKGSDGR
jgi:hypothetical protein